MALPPSHQCCTLAPAQAEYTPKGEYADFNGLKTYWTGPTDTGKAVLYVYDVFGFSPQALQGADLLASAGYRVAIPDFLQGNYATPEMFSGTPEGNAARAKLFGGFPGVPTSQSEQIGKALDGLKAQGYAKVGASGFCWGWKAIVSAEKVNEFDAISAAHPSFIDVADAEKIKGTPVLLLPSGGEDKATVDGLYAALEKANPGNNFIKWYPDDVHGFAAARADLKDDKQRGAFHDAFVQFTNFFKAKL
ncbi:putative AIM2 family protein [Vanrija pseudolonga]|uniref:Purtative AIM2 family protein n=1 Tax=Vanrija pseudolonga TaxID=143232 RepID=A0AAF0Y3T4_9TREE|nr:purtative AIM2 family protein [Vanrija pseudolonga]